MSNLNNLTSKIVKEAEAKRDTILAEAKKEKEEILVKYNNKAKEEAEAIIEKAKRDASSKKDRIISSAELKVRNEKLALKQEKISDVFDLAVVELSKLDEAKLTDYMKKSIKAMDFEGEATLILGDNTKISNAGALVSEINTEISANGKKVVLASENRKNVSGFIVEKNGVEINNTFGALVDSIKEDLEYEVAKVLFN